MVCRGIDRSSFAVCLFAVLPVVAIAGHGDGSLACAETLSDALTILCGPYRRYNQFCDELTELKKVPCNMAEAASHLSLWRQRRWGHKDGREVGVDDLAGREEKMENLCWALRSRDLREVESVWRTLTEDERQAWGRVIIEDEIDRWKKLVRLQICSRNGDDSDHCFYVGLGLTILSRDHQGARDASILAWLDKRWRWTILRRARCRWRDANGASVAAACKRPLEARAKGQIKAPALFDEDVRVIAQGKFCVFDA